MADARAPLQSGPRARTAGRAIRSPPVLLVGVGNRLRGDDAAGLELARLVAARTAPGLAAVREHAGEPLDLIESLAPFEAVVIADAMRSGAPPGASRRLDVSHTPLPRELRSSTSTHAISLGDAIELARALGRLPPRVIVYALEGQRFTAGSPISEPVRAALPAIADTLLRELRTLPLAP